MDVDVFIIVAMLYDYSTQRRIHPALLWGGIAQFSLPLLLLVANTPAGLAFADTFR